MISPITSYLTDCHELFHVVLIKTTHFVKVKVIGLSVYHQCRPPCHCRNLSSLVTDSLTTYFGSRPTQAVKKILKTCSFLVSSPDFYSEYSTTYTGYTATKGERTVLYPLLSMVQYRVTSMDVIKNVRCRILHVPHFPCSSL